MNFFANQYVRTCAIAASAFVLVSAGGAVRADGQILKEILDRMDGNYRTLTTVRANITMKKTDPNTGTSDTYVGVVNAIPERKKQKGQKDQKLYARIDWSKPKEVLLAVDRKYWLYRPALNQVLTGSSDTAKKNAGAGNVLSFMSATSKAQLQAEYDVKYAGQETIAGGLQVWHIELTPKTKKSYTVADMWVDPDGFPRQVRIQENSGDIVEILLTKVEKNPTIDAKIFSTAEFKGAKVIQG